MNNIVTLITDSTHYNHIEWSPIFIGMELEFDHCLDELISDYPYDDVYEFWCSNTIALACIQDNLEVFKLLINYLLTNNQQHGINSNLNVTIGDGDSETKELFCVSPLGVVCICNSVKIGEYLLNSNSNSNTNNSGNSLAKDIDIHLFQGINMSTPLSFATMHGSLEIVQLLLKHDKMTTYWVNKADENGDGDRPLHYAVYPDECSLIRKGCDVFLQIAHILISDQRTNPNLLSTVEKLTPLYTAINVPHYFDDDINDDGYDLARDFMIENATKIALFLISHEKVDITIGTQLTNGKYDTPLKCARRYNKQLVSAVEQRFRTMIQSLVAM